MKLILSFIVYLMFVITLPLKAQTTDYNTIILPKFSEELPIEEKLVILAWDNNPENNILKNESEIAKYDYQIQKTSWLDNINLSGNLNQFIIQPSTDPLNRSAFFPLYNIGASISLGIFFSQPKAVQIKKLLHLNSLENINAKKNPNQGYCS